MSKVIFKKKPVVRQQGNEIKVGKITSVELLPHVGKKIKSIEVDSKEESK